MNKRKWIFGIGAVVLVISAVVSVIVVWNSPAEHSGPMWLEGQPLGGSRSSGSQEPGQNDVSREQGSGLSSQDKSALEQMLAGKRPALVTLWGGDDASLVMGSGFIVDEADGWIYICTSRHVIENYEDWEVGFCDGTTAAARKVGVSSTYDVGIVKVEKKQLPAELSGKLFKLEIDLEHWSALADTQVNTVFTSMYQEPGVETYVSGLLLHKLADYPWEEPRLRHSLFATVFTDGDSGSAIFDESGYLISMVHGTAYANESEPPQRWGIPLSAIAVAYMEIMNSSN